MTAIVDLTGDLIIKSSATYEITIQVLEENGQPFDFTDFVSLEFNMSPTNADDTGDYSLTLTAAPTNVYDSGVEFISPKTQGKVRVQIAASSTPSVYTGGTSGVFDIHATITDGGNEPYVVRAVEGNYAVKQKAH